jgi:hypothetical protein
MFFFFGESLTFFPPSKYDFYTYKGIMWKKMTLIIQTSKEKKIIKIARFL